MGLQRALHCGASILEVGNELVLDVKVRERLRDDNCLRSQNASASYGYNKNDARDMQALGRSSKALGADSGVVSAATWQIERERDQGRRKETHHRSHLKFEKSTVGIDALRQVQTTLLRRVLISSLLFSVAPRSANGSMLPLKHVLPPSIDLLRRNVQSKRNADPF